MMMVGASVERQAVEQRKLRNAYKGAKSLSGLVGPDDPLVTPGVYQTPGARVCSRFQRGRDEAGTDPRH